MDHHSDDSPDLSHDRDKSNQIDQPTESPELTLQEMFSKLPSAEVLRDQLSRARVRAADASSPDPASEDDLSPAQEDADFLDVDEAMCRHALLLHLKGQTYQEIADVYGRSERTIRRWVKKAKERGLLRVDKLKPWEQPSEVLVMTEQYRAELLNLKQSAQKKGDAALELRCLRELFAMEEKRLRILDKVGLFDGYSAYRSPMVRIMERFDVDSDCRTEVEDDEFEDEEDEDYEDDEDNVEFEDENEDG